ncbi:hypothetical protein GEMRC1_004825 [Eukaryota sp. GEM-RC1]
MKHLPPLLTSLFLLPFISMFPVQISHCFASKLINVPDVGFFNSSICREVFPFLIPYIFSLVTMRPNLRHQLSILIANYSTSINYTQDTNDLLHSMLLDNNSSKIKLIDALIYSLFFFEPCSSDTPPLIAALYCCTWNTTQFSLETNQLTLDDFHDDDHAFLIKHFVGILHSFKSMLQCFVCTQYGTKFYLKTVTNIFKLFGNFCNGFFPKIISILRQCLDANTTSKTLSVFIDCVIDCQKSLDIPRITSSPSLITEEPVQIDVNPEISQVLATLIADVFELFSLAPFNCLHLLTCLLQFDSNLRILLPCFSLLPSTIQSDDTSLEIQALCNKYTKFKIFDVISIHSEIDFSIIQQSLNSFVVDLLPWLSHSYLRLQCFVLDMLLALFHSPCAIVFPSSND